MSRFNSLIVIQARSGSTRLPRKMTMPFFEGKTILEIIIQELLSFFDNKQIVLATSKNQADSAIEEIALKTEVQLFRGSEHNVLKRFNQAIQRFDATRVARVCGDNPFLRAFNIQALLEVSESSDADYSSYAFPDGTPSILSHCGLYAEVLKPETISHLNQVAITTRHREHLTSYILDNPHEFKVNYLPVPPCVKNVRHLRLTVDTLTDFETAQVIYSNVYRSFGKNFSVEQLITSLGLTPAVFEKMKQEIEINKKK